MTGVIFWGRRWRSRFCGQRRPVGRPGARSTSRSVGIRSTGTVRGGIGGPIATNTFNLSLYAQTIATPMIQSGSLSHFSVHFTANVSKSTTLVVRHNGVGTTIGCTVAIGTNTCSGQRA